MNDATAVREPEQGQRAPRKQVVGASVNGAEKLEIEAALTRAFFDTKPSNAARRVLVAFARSVAVRRAVRSFLDAQGESQ